MTAQSNSTSNTPWLLILLLALCWGMSFNFTDIVVTAIPVSLGVFLRLVIGAVVIWTIILLRRRPLQLPMKTFFFSIALGLFNNALPFFLISTGQLDLSPGLVSVINASTPLLIALLAHFALKDEGLNGMKIIGIVLSFAGVIIIIGITEITEFTPALFSQLLILLANLFYAIATVSTRIFSKSTTARDKANARSSLEVLAALQLTFAALWLLPSAFEHLPLIPSILDDNQLLLALIGVGFISTGLAYLIYFRILATAGTSAVGIAVFFIPLVTITIDALYAGTLLTTNQFIGAAILIFGQLLIDQRLFRRWLPKSQT